MKVVPMGLVIPMGRRGVYMLPVTLMGLTYQEYKLAETVMVLSLQDISGDQLLLDTANMHVNWNASRATNARAGVPDIPGFLQQTRRWAPLAQPDLSELAVWDDQITWRRSTMKLKGQQQIQLDTQLPYWNEFLDLARLTLQPSPKSLGDLMLSIPNLSIIARTALLPPGKTREWGSSWLTTHPEYITYYDDDDLMHPVRTRWLWEAIEQNDRPDALYHGYNEVTINRFEAGEMMKEWFFTDPLTTKGATAKRLFGTREPYVIEVDPDKMVKEYCNKTLFGSFPERYPDKDFMKYPEQEFWPVWNRPKVHQGWITLKTTVLKQLSFSPLRTGEDLYYFWKLLYGCKRVIMTRLILGLYNWPHLDNY